MGAPNYSPVQNPEAGRVYVYRNNAVSTCMVQDKVQSTVNDPLKSVPPIRG